MVVPEKRRNEPIAKKVTNPAAFMDPHETAGKGKDLKTARGHKPLPPEYYVTTPHAELTTTFNFYELCRSLWREPTFASHTQCKAQCLELFCGMEGEDIRKLVGDEDTMSDSAKPQPPQTKMRSVPGWSDLRRPGMTCEMNHLSAEFLVLCPFLSPVLGRKQDAAESCAAASAVRANTARMSVWAEDDEVALSMRSTAHPATPEEGDADLDLEADTQMTNNFEEPDVQFDDVLSRHLETLEDKQVSVAGVSTETDLEAEQLRLLQEQMVVRLGEWQRQVAVWVAEEEVADPFSVNAYKKKLAGFEGQQQSTFRSISLGQSRKEVTRLFLTTLLLTTHSHASVADESQGAPLSDFQVHIHSTDMDLELDEIQNIPPPIQSKRTSPFASDDDTPKKKRPKKKARKKMAAIESHI
ncbi:MAG: uncharacterized protein KVP18_003996 [Porospora cf. gigantea A]|nr:MAG: hypothetical protein KVP18_003996 [Porospora cf. gigantea A]